MLLCVFFLGSNRNYYYFLLVFVMRALATSASMYVRVPTEIKKIMHYDTYRSTMGTFVTVNIICFGTKCDAKLEMMSGQVFTSSKTNKHSSPADVKQNKRSRVCHRKIQNISNYRLEMMPILAIIQALQTSRYNRFL